MVIVDGAVSILAPGYKQPPTRWCALMQKILFVMLYSYAIINLLSLSGLSSIYCIGCLLALYTPEGTDRWFNS